MDLEFASSAADDKYTYNLEQRHFQGSGIFSFFFFPLCFSSPQAKQALNLLKRVKEDLMFFAEGI